MILEYLLNNKVRVEGIIDTNSEKKKEINKNEIPLVSLSDILEPAFIVVTIKDNDTVDKIIEQVNELNRNIKIVQYNQI